MTTYLTAFIKQYWVGVLLATVYLIMGVAFSVANPIHEATDELRHYRYVRYIADLGKLPVQSGAEGNAQAHHPPLYYASAALTSFWVQVSDPLYEPEQNPYWSFRNWEVGEDNKNLYIHGPDETWPYRDAALAARVARWTTLLWGAGAVLLTYVLAATVTPERKSVALAAAGLVALNPMFIYLGAAVNNDVPAGLAGAAITFLCILTVRDGFTNRRAILLGVLYGLAMLVKFNLLAMGGLIAAAMLLAPSEENRWRRLITGLGIVIGVSLLISGWWYVRNTILYGEPTGFLRLTEIWGFRNPTEGVSLTGPELAYAWTSLWGRFGYGQIPLPTPIYTITAVLCGLGIVGLAAYAIREREQVIALAAEWRMLIILALAALLNFAVLYAYITVSPAGAMGRFFFPGLPAFATLVAVGLTAFLPEKPAVGAGLAVNVGLGAIVIVALVGYLMPAYARPEPAAVDVGAPHIQIGEVARVYDAQVDVTEVRPGSQVDVTVTWRVLEQTDVPYSVFLRLETPQGLLLAERVTYTGLGSYPSHIWQAGDTFKETYRLFVPETVLTPNDAFLMMGLFHPERGRLPIEHRFARNDAIRLAEVSVPADPGAEYPNETFINYGDHFALVGYEIEPAVLWQNQKITVRLYWQALDVPQERDYLVFLHLRERNGWEVYAGQDGNPVFHDASTRDWEPGEVYIDERTFRVPADLEPDTYELELGWFADDTEDRLLIYAEDGRIVDDWLRLHNVLVLDNPND